MATKFKAAPAPELDELGWQPHQLQKAWEGRTVKCARCPLPPRNRIHVDPSEAQRAEWARYDAARLGERDE